jgi:hypothetical protein
VGVDSQPNAVAPAVQTEAAGVGVSELPVTDGNEPQGLANPTVIVNEKPYTIVSQDEGKFVVNDGMRIPRTGGLGKAIAAQLEAQTAPAAEVLTPTVETPAAVEAAAPTVETPAAIEAAAPAVEMPAAIEAAAPAVEAPTAVETAAPTVEMPAVEAAAPTVEMPVIEAAAPTVGVPAVESLKAEQEKLLTSSGQVPAPKSKARKAYDALQVQIDELAPTLQRGQYEPPIKEGLSPVQESKLRTEYETTKQEAANLEKVRDELEERLFRGQDLYNEGQKQAINAQLTSANKAWNAAAAKAEKTYWKLFDKDKADAEGQVGENYISAENAKRAEAARLAKAPVEQRGSYPYNLTSLDAVHEELRDQMSHMPEYKAYVEKYFTVDRKRLKNKVSEKEAIAEGQKLIATRTLYNVQALNSAVPTPDGFAEAAAKGQTRKALQIVLNHPQADTITKLVIRSILKAGTLPKLSVVPEGTLGTDTTAKKVRVGEYDPVSDTIRLDEGYLTAANLIHEVMHGFLHRKVADYLSGKHKDAQIKRIDDLFQHLTKNHPELAESYGMTDLSEFVSEVMSNDSFQNKLKDIPYKKGSFFSEFAKAVLKLLGINDTTPKWNALAEALVSTESVMQSGRALQEVRTGTAGPKAPSNITPSEVAAAERANIIGQNAEPTTLEKIKKFKDTKLTRTNIVDVTSSVNSKIFAGYAGQLRDITGEIIPTEHLAQALDAARVAERSLVEGGVGLTKDGLFTAVSLGKLPTGEEISAKGISSIIAKSAKQSGLTFEKAQEVFDSQLAAHREHEIDIYNNQPTTAVPIELRIDPAKRQVLEAQFQKNTEAQKIAKIMDTMRFNRIDALVTAGRITPKKAQFWKDVTGYVPFQSMDALIEKMAQSAPSTGKGLGGKTTYFSIKGGTDQLASVVDTFQVKMANMVVDAIKTNAVSKASQTLVLLGHAKMVNPLASITNEEESRSEVTYVNGKPQRFIYDDPLDAVAFAAMPSVVSSSVDLLQTMSRVLRTSVTWGLKFAVGQVIQDVTRAYAMSDVNNPAALIPRILLNFPRAAFGEFTGKRTPVQQKLENMGVMSTVDTGVRGTVKSIQIEIGAKNRNAMDMFLHVMESIAKGSDAAVRQAIYTQSMKETKGDEALSLSRAREIINFSRRGSSRTIDFLIRTVPFTNAYIRGMDKLYDTARLTTTGKGSIYGMTPLKAKRMFATRALTIAGTWAVYSMMMGDDEEYQALDDNVRDSNIILPFIRVGDSPLAIPLPRDIAYFYKAIPERLITYYNKYGTEEEQSILRVTGELLRQGRDTLLSPGVVPSALVPFVETATNYSFFLGRDLESVAQQQQGAAERFGRGTSELAKEAGQLLDMSPIKIDNFIRGLFGTMGAMVLGITDKIIDPERTETVDKKDLLVQLSGLSNLMIDPVGRKQTNALYKLEEKVTQVNNEYTKKMARDKDEGIAFGRKNEKYLAVSPDVKQTFEMVQKLNEQIRYFDADKRATPMQRQKYIAEIAKEQNDIAKRVDSIQAYLDKN